MRVPRETGDRKPRGSNPVAPTIFRKKRFGPQVEELFCLCGKPFRLVLASSIHSIMRQGSFWEFSQPVLLIDLPEVQMAVTKWRSEILAPAVRIRPKKLSDAEASWIGPTWKSTGTTNDYY